MSNYIYPKLSKYEITCICRLGVARLGNLLFAYSRVIIGSKNGNIPIIWLHGRVLK